VIFGIFSTPLAFLFLKEGQIKFVYGPITLFGRFEDDFGRIIDTGRFLDCSWSPGHRMLNFCWKLCATIHNFLWLPAEMITIRFSGWKSGRIVSLQPGKDIQKLLSNGNRIRTRISETLLSIFRGFRLLEKVAHCTIIHLLSSEASSQPSAP